MEVISIWSADSSHVTRITHICCGEVMYNHMQDIRNKTKSYQNILKIEILRFHWLKPSATLNHEILLSDWLNLVMWLTFIETIIVVWLQMLLDMSLSSEDVHELWILARNTLRFNIWWPLPIYTCCCYRANSLVTLT